MLGDTQLTVRKATRDVEQYHDAAVRLSQAVTDDNAIIRGVGTVAGAVADGADALRRVTQAVIDANVVDGSGGYRQALDSLHCAVRVGVDIRRVAESLIARLLHTDIHHVSADGLRRAHSCDGRQFFPGLLALIHAADTCLSALATARTTLDVPDGTGRTRRSLPARANAAAEAAAAHALRAERIGAAFRTPCPEGPAFTRAQAQLAHAVARRVPMLTSAAPSETVPHRVAIEQRRRDRRQAHHATILAEAYEQVSRTCVALVSVRGVIECIDRATDTCIVDLREQAAAIADSAICLCASTEAGQNDLVDMIRRQADAAERVEDAVGAMFRSTVYRSA